MLIGVAPYKGADKHVILENMKMKDVVFPSKEKFDIDYSEEVKDLVLNLLARERYERLGNNGDADEVLSHSFF